MPVQVKIVGLERVMGKLGPGLISEPLRDFFKRAAIAVQGRARENAPVDTGHLRNMIQYEVGGRSGNPPLYAKVGLLGAAPGTPLWFKGRAMEFGTGAQGDPEVSHKASHWPPGAALGLWARRHGMASGFAVAAGIGKRGGLRARPYLRPALENSLGEIRGFLRRLGEEIRARWG